MNEEQLSLVQQTFTREALTLNHILNYENTGRNRTPWLLVTSSQLHQVCLVAVTPEMGLSVMEQLKLDWDKLVLVHSTCLGPSLGTRAGNVGRGMKHPVLELNFVYQP